MIVGVLALQGDFAEHIEVFQQLGGQVREVRTVADLEAVDRLVIPGGESTTINQLLVSTGLDEAIVKRVQGGMPVFGTCAGLIILAQLGVVDVDVERNAYGRQLQSFQADIQVKGMDNPLPVSFIRAPVITRVGDQQTC